MTEKRDVTDSPPPERDQRTDRWSNQDPADPNADDREPPRGGSAHDGDESNDNEEEPLMPEPMSTPVLAGQIEREHAAFVVLGALATVAAFLQLSGIWL